jgi:general secretion pathway protein E
MSYQSLLETLQKRDKLSASELKKVERVKKTSVAESLPQLLVKLGLCSELDVADAFVESGRFEKVTSEQYPLEMQLPETSLLKSDYFQRLTQLLMCNMAKTDRRWISCLMT